MTTSNTSRESPSWLVSGTLIEGVRHRYLDVNPDRRGSFTDVFRDVWDTGVHPRQWSVVDSQARVLRGMHLHFGHDEYICVLRGSASIGLHDLRHSSGTRGCHALIRVDDACPAYVTFPRGVLHGWYFHEASIHLQAISNTFDEYGSRDNWGCHFSDPDLGIPWPDPEPVLSDRARHFPTLRRLEEVLTACREAGESGREPPQELLSYADTGQSRTLE